MISKIVLLILGVVFVVAGIYGLLNKVNSWYIFTKTPRPSSAKPRNKKQKKMAQYANWSSIALGIILVLTALSI